MICNICGSDKWNYGSIFKDNDLIPGKHYCPGCWTIKK